MHIFTPGALFMGGWGCLDGILPRIYPHQTTILVFFTTHPLVGLDD